MAAPILSPADGATLPFPYGTSTTVNLSASNGTAPYSYSLVSGSLPVGVSMSSTGVLSGTPTVPGNYILTVRVTDSAAVPETATATYTLQVDAPVLTIAPSALPDGTVGASYSVTLSTTGGVAPYSYSLLAGALPVGVSFSSGGQLSGVPRAHGNFSLTVRSLDAHGQSTSRVMSLTIAAPTLVISPPALPGGSPGVAYSQTLSTSGGVAPYTYSLVSGSLPIGISFSSAGAFSGTPTVAGTHTLTVRSTDDAGYTATQTYTIAIGTPVLNISPPALPDAVVGVAYGQSLSTTGGTAPYTYSLQSGALPAGMAFSSAGTLSGTPVVAGNFTFTVQATDDNGFTGTQAYTIRVMAPTLVLSPATLPGGTAGVAYSQSFSTSGGTAPYTYSLSSGALPIGMSLSSAGMFSGTPIVAGSYTFTLQSRDSYGTTVSQSYTVAIAAPSLVIAPDALPGGVVGTAYSAMLGASGGTAPYSYSLVSGALPVGISFSSAGALSGTPAATGTTSFTVRATDALGFTADKAYSLAIAIASAAPVAVDDTATALSQQAISVAVTGNDAGSITSIAIETPPQHGTATIDGLNIVYTSVAAYAGADSVRYVAIGPGGSSAPATLRLTIQPRPVALSRQIETTAGVPVTASLTEGAQGGPFTAAAVVSLLPAAAGTTSLASDYRLTFTPAAGFTGTATVRFTLSNAYATSEAAELRIVVTARPDPTLDNEVMGLLGAQVMSARRLATTQIANFQQRLESLHSGGREGGGFHNGLSFAADPPCTQDSTRSPCLQSRLADEQAGQAAPTATRQVPVAFGLWTGGAIHRGDRDASAGRSGFDFRSSGVSAGADYRASAAWAFGGGIGYGRDDSDVGRDGSRSEADAYTVAAYASFHPGDTWFVDGLAGYQWLRYDLRRHVGATGDQVRGERDGAQWFVSLSLGGDYRRDRLNISPYVRWDIARARLDGYTESGDAIHSLRYGEQDVDTQTASLGVRMDYRHAVKNGSLTPQFRLEYQHDFEDDSSVMLSYADLPAGPLYRADVAGLDRNRFVFGLGAAWQNLHGLTLRLEYRGLFGSEGDSDHGVLFNLQKGY